MRAQSMVEPNARGDVDDVRADELADARDLVDEADARGKERVRRQLDHLGRGDVGEHDRRVEWLVERCHSLRMLRLEGADDDAVRVHEVVHGRALGEKLRVGDVGDLAQSASVQGAPHLLARAGRDSALHDERCLYAGGQLVDDGPHGREVGVAGVCRGRADGDERELGSVQSLADVEREAKALAHPFDHVLQSRLVDRDAAAAQRVDLVGQDVADNDVVTELRQAGPGDEAHVACSEDGDAAHG